MKSSDIEAIASDLKELYKLSKVEVVKYKILYDYLTLLYDIYYFYDEKDKARSRLTLHTQLQIKHD